MFSYIGLIECHLYIGMQYLGQLVAETERTFRFTRYFPNFRISIFGTSSKGVQSKVVPSFQKCLPEIDVFHLISNQNFQKLCRAESAHSYNELPNRDCFSFRHLEQLQIRQRLLQTNFLFSLFFRLPYILFNVVCTKKSGSTELQTL